MVQTKVVDGPLRRGQIKEAQQASHAAKGTARSVMATELAELFASVERHVTDEEWSAAESQVAEANAALERARDFVATL